MDGGVTRISEPHGNELLAANSRLLEEHIGTLYSGDVVYDGGLIDNLPNSDVDGSAQRETFSPASMAMLCTLVTARVWAGRAFADWPRAISR